MIAETRINHVNIHGDFFSRHGAPDPVAGPGGFHWFQLLPPFGLAMYTRSVSMGSFITCLKPPLPANLI